MWYLRRVKGDSMNPNYRDGQVVLVSYLGRYSVGDVVVALMDGREVIKRISKMSRGKFYLVGDNLHNSTDSRTHGWIMETHLMGRVVWPRRNNL